MPRYTLTLTDTPDPADVEVVKQGLDAYDASQGAVVDWVPLALFARDEEGAIVAGLTGSTYWGYLYVGRLWTDERLRKTGLGSRLLLAAEQEAVRRSCHSVHLMTGSFNALPFYHKRGYAVFGTLTDMPPGHTQYFMRKRLGRQSQQITLTRTIRASPIQVYGAFTRAEGWCAWCCEAAEADARLGGKLHIYMDGYNAYGEFRMLDPDRAVTFTWDGDNEPPMLIRVLLDGQDNSTFLTFQVVGLCSEQDWAALAGFLDRPWGHALDNLKKLLER